MADAFDQLIILFPSLTRCKTTDGRTEVSLSVTTAQGQPAQNKSLIVDFVVIENHRIINMVQHIEKHGLHSSASIRSVPGNQTRFVLKVSAGATSSALAKISEVYSVTQEDFERVFGS